MIDENRLKIFLAGVEARYATAPTIVGSTASSVIGIIREEIASGRLNV